MIPVLVLSLFNGIGCCFRCYELCGVQPEVCTAYEINAAANRVTSRRWPHVKMFGDIRTLTFEEVRQWRYLYLTLQKIHVWFGFPCAGLFLVRAGRFNLEAPESGLFWEAIRVEPLHKSPRSAPRSFLRVRMWPAWMLPPTPSH